VNQNSFWWRLVHMNPALFRGGVVAVVTVAGLFGIVVIPGLDEKLVAVWVPLMAIVQAVWTRDGVTPNEKVVVFAPDPVMRPRAVEAGQASTSASDTSIVDAARETPASIVSGQD
jgi:hypothetical protein